MISLLGKITRHMPSIPYKANFVGLFKCVKSKKNILINDYQKTMILDLDINYEMQSRLLQPESVFIDIGANFGEFTILAAKYITHGNIFSFEPDPKMFCKLKNNCELNNLKNVHLF